MKCVLILCVIGIFCPRIFAEDSSEIAAGHNKNITRGLTLKIVKMMDNGIETNSSISDIQISFSKAKEEALIQFNATKIGIGYDLVDRYYDELKRALDTLNGTFFKTLTLFNKAIAYYKNYIDILMLTSAPKIAHESMKNRTFAEFERKANINGNELFNAFKHKLDKELDFQFQWTFPGIDTDKYAGGNNNSNATLGNTTSANNSTEKTTTEISQTKND